MEKLQLEPRAAALFRAFSKALELPGCEATDRRGAGSVNRHCGLRKQGELEDFDTKTMGKSPLKNGIAVAKNVDLLRFTSESAIFTTARD